MGLKRVKTGVGRIFRGYSRELLQQEWLVPIGAFLFISLLSFEFVGVGRSPVRMQVTIEKVHDTALTCSQVAQLGRWTGGKYGGPVNINMQSSDFSSRVADTFLEKLDPYKLIFLRPEAEAFRKQAKTAWASVIKSGECQAFETWVSDKYEEAKVRTESILDSLPFDVEVGKRAHEAQFVTDKAPHYDSYAKDGAGLSKRLALYGSRIAEFTSRSVLPAYNGSVKRLVRDSLGQLLFGDPLVARNVLAKAMLGSLDPYSTYLSSSEYDEFYQELAGGTSGIGIKVRKVPAGLLIEKVLDDSPADREAVLHEGVILTAVDGHPLREATLMESKKLLKGEEASRVRLDWMNPVNSRKGSVVVTRARFDHDDSKLTERLAYAGGRRVAVISVPTFYGRGGSESSNAKERSSAEDLEKLIRKLNAQATRPAALVLDLRGNPGGFLEEAVSMGGLFIGNQPVVGVVDRNDRRVLRDHRAPLYSGPLVVLLDKESASASEVLAGALKDLQRAIVIGDSASYGKGSVQRLFHLQDELTWLNPTGQIWTGVVKLTTSVFYSPLGHSPANGGVAPNIKLAAAPRASQDFESHPKKMWAIPETTPFLEAKEIKRLSLSAPSYQKKLGVLQERNPWLAATGIPLSKAVKYLVEEERDSANESDEILDKAVYAASEYSRIEQMMSQSDRISASRTADGVIRNARRNVVGY